MRGLLTFIGHLFQLFSFIANGQRNNTAVAEGGEEYPQRSPRYSAKQLARMPVAYAQMDMPDKDESNNPAFKSRGQDEQLTHVFNQPAANQQMQDGTTGFDNTANTTGQKFQEPQDLDAEYLDTGSTHYQQSVKEFLAKPIQFGSADFTAAQTQNTQLITLLCDRGLFAGQPGTIWGNKLTGFMGIRGTLRFRL